MKRECKWWMPFGLNLLKETFPWEREDSLGYFSFFFKSRLYFMHMPLFFPVRSSHLVGLDELPRSYSNHPPKCHQSPRSVVFAGFSLGPDWVSPRPSAATAAGPRSTERTLCPLMAPDPGIRNPKLSIWDTKEQPQKEQQLFLPKSKETTVALPGGPNWPTKGHAVLLY